MAHAALIELLDAGGHVRQSFVASAWPLRIGRALDNDIVLADPHVAAHHCTIARSDAGTVLTVGDTRNGVQAASANGTLRLAAGQQHTIVAADAAPTHTALTHIDLTIGLTRLRLRLPEFALAAELPVVAAPPLARRALPTVAAALVLLVALLFNTYLDNDPDTFARAIGSTLMTAVLTTAVWCSAWALLSKTFTARARFGWHLRVFLLAAIALLAVEALPNLVSFALSWPGPADFAFVGTVAVAASALYFHLLAVEPARRRLLKAMAVIGAVAGVVVMLWSHVQRTDRFGDELYMSHLFPPSWRLAKPVAAATFIDGLASLKLRLDQQAITPSRGGAEPGDGNRDED